MLSFIGRHKVTAAISLCVLILGILIGLQMRWSNRFMSVEAKRGKITEAIYGIGTVKANKVYEQRLGITGSVYRLYVKEGDNVAKNQLLMRTNEGVIFRTPFQGVVTRIFYHEGEIVMPGSIILRVINMRDTYVSVNLDQNSALRVKRKQPAKLSFESLRGGVIEGEVTKIYPAEDGFLVRIEVEKMPEEILPDMTADVAIEVATRENLLMIPVAAINNGFVRLKRDGEKMKVKAEIGVVNSQWAEVLSNNIKDGDEIMVERQN